MRCDVRARTIAGGFLLALVGPGCGCSGTEEPAWYLADFYRESSRILHEFVSSEAWSPDGTQLLVAIGERAILYGSPTEELWADESPPSWYTVAFAPDGEHFALGSLSGQVAVWEANTRRKVIELSVKEKEPPVSALAFTPDGRELLIGDWHDRVRRWVFVEDTPPKTIASMTGERYSDGIEHVEVFPDGERCLIAGGRGLGVLNIESGGEQLWLSGEFNAADLSPDGTILVAAQGAVAEVRSTVDGSLLARTPEHEQNVKAVAFLEDGARFITGDQRGAVAVWDSATGALVQELVRLDRVSCIAPRPGASEVAVGLALYRLGVPPADWQDWATEAAATPEDLELEGFTPVVHVSGKRYADAGVLLGCHLNLDALKHFPSIPAEEMATIGARCEEEILRRAAALGADVTGLARFFDGGFRRWSELDQEPPDDEGGVPLTEKDFIVPDNPVVPYYVDRVLWYDRPVWIVVGRARTGHPYIVVDAETGELITFASVG